MSRDWLAYAACTGADPEAFFPTATAGNTFKEQAAAAKAVCRRCPVQRECLEWALDTMPHGICGGKTVDERRALRESLGKPPLPELVCNRKEQAEAGRAAIRDGAAFREAAHMLGVSERTAERWAVQVRQEAGRAS